MASIALTMIACCSITQTPTGQWNIDSVADYHIETETKLTLFRTRHFQKHFFNENAWTSLKILLKFVPKVRINNIPALIQIMAWRRPGDKPLSEPMMVSLLTHICVTRSQWVKAGNKTDFTHTILKYGCKFVLKCYVVCLHHNFQIQLLSGNSRGVGT